MGKFPKAHSRVADLKNFSQTLPQDEGCFGNFPKASLIIEENFGKTPMAKSLVREDCFKKKDKINNNEMIFDSVKLVLK